jgi:hypothetical protein
MTIETRIIEYKETSRIFFAFCDSCFDVNEETGDPQNGSLQLSGDGAKSLEEAEKQVKEHLEYWSKFETRNHRTRIDCI